MVSEKLQAIQPLKEKFFSLAQERLDALTKPQGSLGQLEEIVKQYVAIVENLNPKIEKKIIYVFAADHGVVAEGVSAYAKEVTSQMVYNFLRGGAGINVLARHAGAKVVIVDVGVDHDFGTIPGLVNRKVVRGTRNIVQGPAMTKEEAYQAIKVGLEMADLAHKEKADLVATGDMGIGNTTPSSAILAALTGLPPEQVTYRGTGINDDSLKRKIAVVQKALRINQPDPRDPMDVLAKVGGLEIAGIAGLIIGCAFHRIPVVVDGFISTAGAMIACALNPLIKRYIFAGHESAEIGHRFMWKELEAKPILNLSLRLGEGTGAALAMGVIEVALKLFKEMATFAEAGVSNKEK
ncbi:MAG: nicotinate-nucleotide--dimethylbenzimidazole phosphoribosyltransferase [Thermodesulfobacteriota bacterium]